jgi:phage FluMu protein Com
MDEIRCNNCQRKLAEGAYTRLAIKCPRCKALNTYVMAASAESAPSHPPARPARQKQLTHGQKATAGAGH